MIHRELRKKGVTRRLVWEEYKEEERDYYRYSQFCELYRRWANNLSPPMRLPHKAGEKLFVDYAGLTMSYMDRSDGKEKKAYIFVATWGASNYTYAEAHPFQTLTSWISGHIRAFEYFGVVGMSDPPGHFMLFCKLQKGGLTDAKRSQRGIQSPFQMDSY
ncbi:MAG: transposase [Candidatus Aminicenantes bacterium]|nr:MAG: transposase [Candidatus Aminicenantes bacterium]